MSKMSQIHAELTAKAAELGFQSIEEAEANGYVANYDMEGNTYFVPPTDELEKAHQAWLKDREIVLGDLRNLLIHKVFDFDIIERAIHFIEKGEC